MVVWQTPKQKKPIQPKKSLQAIEHLLKLCEYLVNFAESWVIYLCRNLVQHPRTQDTTIAPILEHPPSAIEYVELAQSNDNQHKN
ncbi:hypothetical protein [Microcoleus sp. herbarium12]|uniref:hypothetical protein n=1 Tax=Microcoleus sp. herbarium12 TaxID=3055437 RepID=UPI002FD3E7D8